MIRHSVMTYVERINAELVIPIDGDKFLGPYKK